MLQTDTYTLYLGDCLDVMAGLEPQSVDAIITDPPYGTTNAPWDAVIPLQPMWECIKRVIKPRGAIVLFGSQPFTSMLVMSNPEWFRHDLVWEKSKPVGFLNAKRVPLRSHEHILVFGMGAVAYNPQKWRIDPIFMDRRKNHNTSTQKSVLYGKAHAYPRGKDDGTRYPLSIIPVRSEWGRAMHPTQKPVDLMEYLIRTYTNEGETVLDFACGSGSTGVAALQTGRRFIGIEREQTYFDTAVRRLNAAQHARQQLTMEVA